MKRSVKHATTHRSFTKAVTKQGGSVESGRRHDRVFHPTNSGSVTLPRHSGDYATGTKFAIIKQLLAIGFVCFPFICLVVWLVNGLA